jgi:hypothetical protein
MKRTVFLGFAFLLAGLLRAQTSPPALVLRGGTLVDVATGKEISDSVIVIRGEQIERVGSGNTGIPERAQIIDAKGKWIIPPSPLPCSVLRLAKKRDDAGLFGRWLRTCVAVG